MNDIELQLELGYLEQLAIKRDYKLDRIALDAMMQLGRFDFFDVSDIQKDNLLTDAQICWHFLHPTIHPEGHELHFKRCEESGIPECTCLVKQCTRQDLEVF